MKLPIILIGPMYSGKSTLGGLLSHKLGIPLVGVDELAERYYLERGLSKDDFNAARDSSNFHDFITVVRPHEIAVAVQIVKENPTAVISFGAGHSYATKPDELSLLLTLRELTPNIFLLLPSQDREISRKVLNERIDTDVDETEERRASKKEVNEKFLDADSNNLLANHIIYTEDHTPEESCTQILSLIY